MSKRHVLVAAAALSATLLLAAQEYVTHRWSGGPDSFDSVLLYQSIGAGVWALLLPVVVLPFWRRYPLGAGQRRSVNFALHAAAGLVLPIVQLSFTAVLYGSWNYGWSPAAYYDMLRDRLHTAYAWNVFVYALIVAGLFALSSTSSAATQLKRRALPQSETWARRILVRNDGRVGVVPVETVDWIEASDNYVVVHAGAATHTVRVPLSRLAQRLDPQTFVRVHRSTVVNVARVREVQPWAQGELVVILRDETRIPIGRRYREKFLQILES